MGRLTYTVIKDEKQYSDYCKKVKTLLVEDEKAHADEIELLFVLIEHWDSQHAIFTHLDPIQLLRELMSDHELRAKDLVSILNLSKGTVSKILNYQKGLSKESIRRLSSYFKMSQEAFNRPYTMAKDGLTAKV